VQKKKSKRLTLAPQLSSCSNEGQLPRRRRGKGRRRWHQGVEFRREPPFGQKGHPIHHVPCWVCCVVDVSLYLCFSLRIPYLLTLLH